MAITAAAAGIMALGSMAGAGITAGANALSNYKQYKYASQLQSQSAKLGYKYDKMKALNQYDWLRTSLENANFNPYLAVQGASGANNASFAPSGSVDAPNYGQAVTNAIDIARLRNETSTAESQINLNNANSELANAQSVEQVIKNKYVDDTIKTNLSNTLASTEKLKAETAMQREMLKYVGYNAESTRIMADANKISANANMLNARINDWLGSRQLSNLREQGLLTEAQTKYYNKLASTKGAEVANQWLRTIGAIGIAGSQLYFTKKLDIRNPVGFGY